MPTFGATELGRICHMGQFPALMVDPPHSASGFEIRGTNE